MAAERNYGITAEKIHVHKMPTLSSTSVGDNKNCGNYEHDHDDYNCNNKSIIM
jgi:hypothetical protein